MQVTESKMTGKITKKVLFKTINAWEIPRAQNFMILKESALDNG
jgi:hypothetical protein